MKKIILLLGVVILVLVSGWWLWFGLSELKPEIIHDPSTQITPTSIAKNVYVNRTWGISLTYPEGWEIREPAFGSAVSYFNLSIEPTENIKYPEPILINITPKYWVDRIIENNNESFFEENINNENWIYYSSFDMGIPTKSYFLLVNNEYWINVSGKEGYEAELQLVLDTLEITPVTVDVSTVGTLP